jgi:phage regulator Rha-like protein
MFQLSWEEVSLLKANLVISSKKLSHTSRSQSVILKRGLNIKFPPYALTEQGVAMLSSVLRSKRAIQVNIEIMRAFVKLRQILASHVELARKLEALEKKYDSQFKVVFEAIRQLMAPKEAPNKRIGFQLREKRAAYSARG